jgi:hypothetical protein
MAMAAEASNQVVLCRHRIAVVAQLVECSGGHLLVITIPLSVVIEQGMTF